jgi:hypothetical protein
MCRRIPVLVKIWQKKWALYTNFCICFCKRMWPGGKYLARHVPTQPRRKSVTLTSLEPFSNARSWRIRRIVTPCVNFETCLRIKSQKYGVCVLKDLFNGSLVKRLQWGPCSLCRPTLDMLHLVSRETGFLMPEIIQISHHQRPISGVSQSRAFVVTQYRQQLQALRLLHSVLLEPGLQSHKSAWGGLASSSRLKEMNHDIRQRRMIGWLMNNELERIRKEMVVAFFKALSRNLPGVTEEKSGKSQSGWAVSGPTFELGTSRIGNSSANRSTETIGVVTVI